MIENKLSNKLNATAQSPLLNVEIAELREREWFEDEKEVKDGQNVTELSRSYNL
jgi:hypothetical protein